VLAHLGVIGLIALALLLAFIAYKVWEHYDALKDFARIAASKIEDPAEYVRALGTSAKVHTLDTFSAMLARLKA
jgi:hypothetical protein